MGRPKSITDERAEWAYRQWLLGCAQIDIAIVLDISVRTLQREFKRRGMKKPTPLPDEEALKQARRG